MWATLSRPHRRHRGLAPPLFVAASGTLLLLLLLAFPATRRFAREGAAPPGPNISRSRSLLNGNPLTDPKTVTTKPGSYFGDASVTVVQAADAAFLKKSDEYMEVNRRWADCAGYDYRTFVLDPGEGGCVYTAKVRAIQEAVKSSEEGGWIVFLDVDAVYQRGPKHCNALEEALPKSFESDGQECEFIASLVNGEINSGVVVVRNTPRTRGLLDRWLGLQAEHESRLCAGPADQITLQEAVLGEFAERSYRRESCLGNLIFKRATSCFEKNLPLERLSGSYMCLADCHTFPLQVRGRCAKTSTYGQNGAVFFHDKQKLLWKIAGLRQQFPRPVEHRQ